MKLALSESQTLLKDTAARFFAEASSAVRVRAAEETGFDPTLWKGAVDLGLIQMRAADPAEAASLLDAAVVAGEAGRRLASAPIVEAIVAAGLLHRVGATRLVDEIAAGAVVTLALNPAAPGVKQIVPAGAVADIIVVLDGGELVVVRPSDGRTRAPNIANSALARLDLSDVSLGERQRVASGKAARDAFDAAIEEWKLLTSAALTGLGRQALEMAAAYSVERVQFGKPIGAYQGIAHPLADSATEMEGARLLVWRAISAIAEQRDDASALVSMAYWWACRVSEAALRRALRTFGGYGLSLEYDVQLYYRRAKFLSLLNGDPTVELDRVAARLWDGVKAPLPPAGAVEIDFSYGVEAEAEAAEFRAFVLANMTEDVQKKKHHSTSGHHPGFHKALAQSGRAFPALEDRPAGTFNPYADAAGRGLWEDLGWTDIPRGLTTFVARMCKLWGQPEAKDEVLSRIIAGDALGCLGFSEPGSGSDVFAARFSAKRLDDGDWLMNGQKIFTTNAHNADYILMLTRSTPESNGHKGLTMFVMPLKLPGVEIQAIHTVQDERTNIVFFGDVRVSDKYRLGEVGDGARVMSSALGFEHGGGAYQAAQAAMVRHAIAWARKPRGNEGAPIQDPTARRVLAAAVVNNQVADSLCRLQVWASVERVHEPTLGPMAKMFSTEAMSADGAAIVALAAPESLVRGLDADLDRVESFMRRGLGMTIYGGSSEVHRSIIAEKSLGMPKSR